jgi:hypothetical protein
VPQHSRRRWPLCCRISSSSSSVCAFEVNATRHLTLSDTGSRVTNVGTVGTSVGRSRQPPSLRDPTLLVGKGAEVSGDETGVLASGWHELAGDYELGRRKPDSFDRILDWPAELSVVAT